MSACQGLSAAKSNRQLDQGDTGKSLNTSRHYNILLRTTTYRPCEFVVEPVRDRHIASLNSFLFLPLTAIQSTVRTDLHSLTRFPTAHREYFMHQGLTETFDQVSHADNPPVVTTSADQHGFPRPQPIADDSDRSSSAPPSRALSSSDAAREGGPVNSDDVDLGRVDQRLGRLSVTENHANHAPADHPVTLPGQRVSEYERAQSSLAAKHGIRPALGFKVVKRPGSPAGGLQLSDFPNGKAVLFCSREMC